MVIDKLGETRMGEVDVVDVKDTLSGNMPGASGVKVHRITLVR